MIFSLHVLQFLHGEKINLSRLQVVQVVENRVKLEIHG